MEAINPGLNMSKLILKFANDEIKKWYFLKYHF
jgi:hypothetical protein